MECPLSKKKTFKGRFEWNALLTERIKKRFAFNGWMTRRERRNDSSRRFFRGKVLLAHEMYEHEGAQPCQLSLLPSLFSCTQMHNPDFLLLLCVFCQSNLCSNPHTAARQTGPPRWMRLNSAPKCECVIMHVCAEDTAGECQGMWLDRTQDISVQNEFMTSYPPLTLRQSEQDYVVTNVSFVFPRLLCPLVCDSYMV